MNQSTYIVGFLIVDFKIFTYFPFRAAWFLNYNRCFSVVNLIFFPPRMDPSTEFRWCLQILRFGFKLIQKDVSDNRRFRFYLIAMSFVIAEICFISTICDEYFDFDTRCVCFGGLIINLQVSSDNFTLKM